MAFRYGPTQTIFRYLWEVLEEDQGDVIDAILAEDIGELAKETYVTLQDRILQRGREEGRQEGREEGRAEGERALVLKQLAFKFGPLSEETRRRVQAASLTELERWAERILEAGRIEELWE